MPPNSFADTLSAASVQCPWTNFGGFLCLHRFSLKACNKSLSSVVPLHPLLSLTLLPNFFAFFPPSRIPLLFFHIFPSPLSLFVGLSYCPSILLTFLQIRTCPPPNQRLESCSSLLSSTSCLLAVPFRYPGFHSFFPSHRLVTSFFALLFPLSFPFPDSFSILSLPFLPTLSTLCPSSTRHPVHPLLLLSPTLSPHFPQCLAYYTLCPLFPPHYSSFTASQSSQSHS